MARWNVQEAKMRLSELIELADTKGPQIITHNGFDCAVVLSITDYRTLIVKPKNLIDYLLNGPKVDAIKVKRSRDMGREIHY